MASLKRGGNALSSQDQTDIRRDIGLGTAATVDVPASGDASSAQVVKGSDTRLTNSREWSAATATQAEAEAGSSTSRLAFTPLRIFQAIAAWWAASSAKTKLDGIEAGAEVNDVTSVAGRTGAVTLAAADVSGAVQIAGDLSGTAAAPVVAKINGVTLTGTPTAGQVPTATSGTAATWQTPSGGGGSVGKLVAAVNNGSGNTQALTSNASTKIDGALNTVLVNPDSWWSTSTKRFTPQLAGTYLFTASVQFNSTSTQGIAQIYKNGGAETASGAYGAAASNQVVSITAVMQANGSTDYFELYAYVSAAGVTVASTAANTQIRITYLGAG